MHSLDSIQFDTTDFTAGEGKDNQRVWYSLDGDGIGLSYFPTPTNIIADLEDIADVRSAYRNLTERSGTRLVECDTLLLVGCRVVRVITKALQKPTGITYLGSLMFPFRDFSFVLKAQCEEVGFTGRREAEVLAELFTSGEIFIDENTPEGSIPGWEPDLTYSVDSSFTGNRSEEEKYDQQFPDHPLSRARRLLHHFQTTIHISDEIRNAPKYLYQRPPASKPWWKIW